MKFAENHRRKSLLLFDQIFYQSFAGPQAQYELSSMKAVCDTLIDTQTIKGRENAAKFDNP